MRLLLSSAIVCLWAFVVPAETGTTDEDAAGILAMAKYAGFCGAITGMVHFQDATKMPGGDEFLARYIATETARQGMEPKDLPAKCKAVIDGYDALFGVMGGKK